MQSENLGFIISANTFTRCLNNYKHPYIRSKKKLYPHAGIYFIKNCLPAQDNDENIGINFRGKHVKNLPVVDASQLSNIKFQRDYDGKKPVLIKGALRDLCNEEQISTWTDEWMEEIQDQEVIYQIRENGVVNLYKLPFLDFIDGAMTESNHDCAWFHMDENLLPPHLRSVFKLDSLLLPDGDWFKYFPESVRPSDGCVFLGGAGARSTLHIDPYEWTGFNFQLEGEKLWTIFKAKARCSEEEKKEIHHLLASYRKVPVEWNDDRNDFCTGWESSIDLYQTKVDDDYFESSLIVSKHNAAVNYTKKSLLLFLEKNLDIYICKQRPGDLIIIPPGYWHQTYYESASMSVAGQYMNRNNAVSILNHILCYNGIRVDQDMIESWTVKIKDGCKSPQEIQTLIKDVISMALERKHGQVEAKALVGEMF